VGVGFAGVGIGIDIYKLHIGDIGFGKFIVDTGMTFIGFAGPIGAAVSITYFGVDAFYPDGWRGVIRDYGEAARMQCDGFSWGFGVGP